MTKRIRFFKSYDELSSATCLVARVHLLLSLCSTGRDTGETEYVNVFM